MQLKTNSYLFQCKVNIFVTNHKNAGDTRVKKTHSFLLVIGASTFNVIPQGTHLVLRKGPELLLKKNK